MDRILLVDDEQLIRWSLKELLMPLGYEVDEVASLIEAIEAIEISLFDLILLDQNLPDGTGLQLMQLLRQRDDATPVVMLTGLDTSEAVVEAMKLGAYDYLTKPIDEDRLKRVIARVLKSTQQSRFIIKHQHAMRNEYGFSSMLGTCDAMTNVFQMCAKLAKNDLITVLITGASGTGKELVAKAIHDGSVRRDKSFMAINCSVLTETLIADELFGHEKGAFTDAKTQKRGIFEAASGGTVFLDEIGDMPLELQAKLLRVLEHKTFKRVGGTTDIEVDVRILAATNQPLEEHIEAKTFRQDLFYRLNVARIELPPLQDRGDDLELLAKYFLNEATKQYDSKFESISDEAMAALRAHNWPGNVRELNNAIDRIVLFYDGEIITAEHVEMILPKVESRDISSESLSLRDMEKRALEAALEKANRNQTQAAKILDISRDTLRYRMRKYDL